jgi:transcriptional regulator with XRE-family HTH domain
MHEKGLKQKFVAERAGMKEGTFSMKLNQNSKFTERDIANLCVGLNVEPNDLFKQEMNE